MKKTEIMSEMDTTVLYLEELDENRLMLEVTPLFTGTKSARVFLDETGIKNLKKFIADLEKPMEHPSPNSIELAHNRLVGNLGVEMGCNDEDVPGDMPYDSEPGGDMPYDEEPGGAICDHEVEQCCIKCVYP